MNANGLAAISGREFEGAILSGHFAPALPRAPRPPIPPETARMQRKRSFRDSVERMAAVLAVGLVLAAGARAFASFREVPRHELVQSADDVVLARVEAVRSGPGVAPGVSGPVAFTEAVVRVERSFRGGFLPGETFAFRVPGGATPDGKFLMVSTSPALEAYESGRALVFVERDAFGPGLHGLAHKALGLYRVETSPAGADVVRGVTGYPIARDLPVAQVPSWIGEATRRR